MIKYNKFTKFFLDIGNRIWVKWSNFRFRKLERYNTNLYYEDKLIYNLDNISMLVKKLYSKFKYTQDGLDQLFDACIPPSEAYKRYREGLLKDDCDGFHCLVYHCLKLNNILCYMLVVSSIHKGHCVLAFYYNSKWYICDYTNIFESTDGLLATAVEEYNNYFSEHYKTKPVKYNCFIMYDYYDGKFKFLSTKKIIGI